jgi:hypothetical protein
MNAIKLLAFGLILAGILGLVIGKFSFARESHNATVGPIEFSVKDRETVNIPLWAGVAAIAAGGLLLLAPVKKLVAS